jgi:c(7)-type cytochrome triheme protein
MFRNLIVSIIMAVLVSGMTAYALDLKNITFATDNAGKVVFSHKIHIRQKQMANNCKACHDTIYPFKKKASYTMADMENGKSCGACHDGKSAFALKECARCHQVKEITIAVQATGPTRFSHKKHLAAEPNCNACHPALFVAGPNKHANMEEMKQGKSCGACHNGKAAFSVDKCASCHPTRDQKYAVKDAGNVTFSHSAHTGHFQCGSCHTKLYATARSKTRVTMQAMEKGKSCGACHNGKNAFASSGDCDKCHKGLKPKEIAFKVKDAAPAIFSHSFHNQAYKCSDCHTKTYPYKAATGKATMADMEKGKSCGACHNGKDAFASSSDCDKCHKGFKPRAITFNTDAGVATFSHEFHSQAYKCADCHTKVFPYKAVTGKATMADMEKGASCGTCHDKGKDAFSVRDDKLCGKCHKM